MFPRVQVQMSGVEFRAKLIMVESMGIDVILGGNWLRSRDGVIYPDQRLVSLRAPIGEMIEFELPLHQAQDGDNPLADAVVENSYLTKNVAIKS